MIYTRRNLIKAATALTAAEIIAAKAEGQILSPILGGSPAATASCSLSFTTGLVGWYKADVGVTGTNPVTAWADQSGTGNNLTGSGGLQLLTSQINGLPGIQFDGSTGFFTGAAVPAGSTTIFVVLKLNSTAAEGFITGSSNHIGDLGYWTASSGKLQGADSSNVAPVGAGTASQDTSAHQINLNFVQSTSYAFRRDRAADGSGSTIVTLTGSIEEIGRAVSTNYLNATVSEVLLYAASLSGPNTTTVENYLNCRYGL